MITGRRLRPISWDKNFNHPILFSFLLHAIVYYLRHNVKSDNEQAPDCTEKCWCLRTLAGLLSAAARLLRAPAHSHSPAIGCRHWSRDTHRPLESRHVRDHVVKSRAGQAH